MDGTEYITLKEAGEISGYSPDYIGQLIRRGKLVGKQVYANVAWVTTRDALDGYLEEKGKGKRIEQKKSTDTDGGDDVSLFSDVPPVQSPSPLISLNDRKEFHSVDDAVPSDILPELEKWERLIRLLSLSIIVCASLFLLLLFHVFSTVLDDRSERRVLEEVSTGPSSHHV